MDSGHKSKVVEFLIAPDFVRRSDGLMIDRSLQTASTALNPNNLD
jgi:hypothetical protein